MTRLAIDPVTRVGGHLRIETEVSNGVVTDAWSSGTMFRGMELILKGRDPRDAWLFAQRVCGTCNGVHALASVRAVENALRISVPRNARLVRNLLAGVQLVQDHVVSFYHRQALDWVDLAAALTADPSSTAALARSTRDRPLDTAAFFLRARDRLARVLGSDQPGPFANGPWGHPAYRLPPEADLMIAADYLEALDWQRRITRFHVLLGGKSPHPQTFLVGGMAVAPPWGGPARPLPGEHPRQVDRNSPIALSPRGLADLADLAGQVLAFVDQVYVPDVLTIAGHHAEWAGIGAGVGNYLSVGDLPEDDSAIPALLLPRGRLMAEDLAAVQGVDQASVAESIAHSHYASDEAGAPPLHPWDGETKPAYGGPQAPVTSLAGVEQYSWLKAPRYGEEPMEVGPLARMLVGYSQGQGNLRLRFAEAAGRLGTAPTRLTGTLGRTVARAIEAQVVAERLGPWLTALGTNIGSGDLAFEDLSTWDPGSWSGEVRGFSLGEGPRGAVGHWVRIRDGRVEAYEIVDATTWNASPRDAQGRRGALEEALVGTPVADPARPLEILRTVRSFDPCPTCAVHVFEPAPGRGASAGSGARDAIEVRVNGRAIR